MDNSLERPSSFKQLMSVTFLTLLGAAFLAFTWAVRSPDFYNLKGVLVIETGLYLLLLGAALYQQSKKATYLVSGGIIIVLTLTHLVRTYNIHNGSDVLGYTLLNSLLESAMWLLFSWLNAITLMALLKLFSKLGSFQYALMLMSGAACAFITFSIISFLRYILFFLSFRPVG